jgi:hypothetical protein
MELMVFLCGTAVSSFDITFAATSGTGKKKKDRHEILICGNLPQHKNQTVATKLTHIPTTTDKHKIT